MRFPWTKTSQATAADGLATIADTGGRGAVALQVLTTAAQAATPTSDEPAADLVAPTAEEATPMTTDDFSDVHAALTPDSPATGDTVTVAITGVDHHTDTSDGSIGPLTLQLAAGGATTNLAVDAVPYTLVSHSDVDVVLTGVTDPSGRAWTVSADGKSAAATA